MSNRHHGIGYALGLALILAASPGARADTDVSGTSIRAQDPVFELATAKHEEKAKAQLINGHVVEFRLRDWPAILIASFKVGVDDEGHDRVGTCTGTFVGPRTVLLAAHCLDQKTDKLRTVYLKADGISIAMDCDVDPQYLKPPAESDPQPRRSEDFGLCHAKTDVLMPSLSAIRYERVDVAAIEAGRHVLMSGFGCSDLDDPGGSSDLRLADAVPSRLPTGQSPNGAFADFESQGPPAPALCQGDSGGPLLTGASVAAQNFPRRIRGVNSWVEPKGPRLISHVAMLSSPTFTPWATGWVTRFAGAYICGLPPEPRNNLCRP